MEKHTFLRGWMVFVTLVLALLIALGGIIYGWQVNTRSLGTSRSLATAQAAEQNARSAEQEVSRQLATAESAMQQALRQQANADSEAQKARSAQATAENAAKQSATSEALAVQENETLQEQTRLATSRELAGKALEILPLDPQLSAHLALQAIEAGYTFEAENALHQVLPYLRLLKSTQISDVVPIAADFSYDSWTLVRDGELLIVGTTEGIYVVDLASGEQSLLVQGKMCTGIKATADGRWLAAECPSDELDQAGSAIKKGQVWDIGRQEIIFTLNDYGNPYGNKIYGFITGLVSSGSPRPLLVLSQQFNGSGIKVWDASSGEALYTLQPSAVNDDWAGAAASSDGTRLATWNWSGWVSLWDLDTGGRLLHFDTQHTIKSAALSPDGNHLATIGRHGWEFETVKIWDISASASEDRLVHEMVLTDRTFWPDFNDFIQFSPDGQYLVGGLRDGQVQVWEVETGDLRMTLSGHAGTTWPISFSQGGMRLYTGSSDGTLKEWDLSPGGALMTLPGRTGSVPYSPDGERLAFITDDGFVSIVDSNTGELQQSWQAYIKWIHNVAWSPDGVRLATVGVDQVDSGFGEVNHPIKVWETATGQLLKEFPGSSYGAVAWSPDGSRVASYSYHNGHISIWDVVSGDELLTLQGRWLSGWAELKFSPDGMKIAYGDAGCGGPMLYIPERYCYYDVIIWDAVSGNELFRLPPAEAEAANLSGKHVGYARPPSYLLEMKSHTSEAHLSLQFASGWIPGIASNMDKEWAGSSGYDDLAMVLDASAGSALYEHRSRRSYAYWSTYPSGLAFSPDSQRLAVGVPGGTVILWKLADGEIVQEGALTGLDSLHGIESIAFSPDGTLLVAWDEAGKIRVWDMETRQVRWELNTIPQTWGFLAFNPDGTRLAASNGEVYVLPIHELTELVRSRLIRPMTTDECQTYLHHETCPEWP